MGKEGIVTEWLSKNLTQHHLKFQNYMSLRDVNRLLPVKSSDLVAVEANIRYWHRATFQVAWFAVATSGQNQGVL